MLLARGERLEYPAQHRRRMPWPESDTATRHVASSALTETASVPPWGMASIPFSNRLTKT